MVVYPRVKYFGHREGRVLVVRDVPTLAKRYLHVCILVNYREQYTSVLSLNLPHVPRELIAKILRDAVLLKLFQVVLPTTFLSSYFGLGQGLNVYVKLLQYHTTGLHMIDDPQLLVVGTGLVYLPF